MVARRAPDLISARLRIQSYAVWDVVVFVLNVLAFMLVGLQLKPIIERSGGALASYAAAAAAVLATVIVVRIVWVMLYTGVARWQGARIGSGAAAVIAWCGMRGIVTLASALALPGADGAVPAFPQRDFILFTAFCVVLGTLVVQGMTVPPLLRALGLPDDGSVEREVGLARAAAARAGLGVVEAATGGGDMIAFLRRNYAARLRRAESPADGDGDPEADDWRDLGAVQHRAQVEERRVVLELRASGVIGDDAFHRVEEELDWAEVGRQAPPSARPPEEAR